MSDEFSPMHRLALYQSGMGAALASRGHLDFCLVADGASVACRIAPDAQMMIGDEDMVFAMLAAKHAFRDSGSLQQHAEDDDLGPEPIKALALHIADDDEEKAAAWLATSDAKAGAYVQKHFGPIGCLSEYLLEGRSVSGAEVLYMLEANKGPG